MLKTFLQLLGKDAPVFHRYIWLAVIYGLICGLSLAATVPLLNTLLVGRIDDALLWLCVLLCGVVVCWQLRCRVEKAGVRVGVAVLQGARHRLGDHVASLPVGWFTPANTAQLSHVVTQGMMVIAQLPVHVFTPLIAGVMTPVVIVVILFFVQGALGLIALVALPLLLGFLMLTTQLARYVDNAFQQDFAQTSQRLVEFAQAQSVLRAFNGEGCSTGFVRQAVEQQYQSGKKLIFLSSLSTVLNTWAVQAIFAVLLVVASLWINTCLGSGLRTEAIISLIISLFLVSRFIDSLVEVVGYGDVLRGAFSQLKTVRQLFDVAPLPEPPVPQTPSDMAVTLREVSFRYSQDIPNAVSGINLTIKPGTMLAVIGESGSGKTTLARLIARFHDVSQGAVMIGGVDVRQISTARLANYISQIFQENYLFSGSIADNIRVGKSDATDADVIAAAEKAGVAEIIKRLPQGIDTPVGEGGVRLSGGERQRIAIARALIKEAPILLVDEATAALDAENQAVIAETLRRLRGSCSLIVIAHQLSTIAMADEVVVLKKGQIIEHGSPQVLQQREGFYADYLAQRRVAKGWRIAPAGALSGTAS